MPRQVLTIIIFALLGLFLFQMCKGPETLDPAVGVEPGRRGDVRIEKLQVGDQTVELAQDGTIVAIHGEAGPILRPVPAYRRPFHLLLRLDEGRKAPLEGRWSVTSVDEGRGRRFALEGEQGLSVVRTVRPAEDGSGLEVRLEVAGLPEKTETLWMTGASGVVLPESGAVAAGTFWVKEGGNGEAGEPDLRSFAALVQAREEERLKRQRAVRADEEPPDRRDQAERIRIASTERVARFGVLGARAAVGFHDLPAGTTSLHMDVYRAERENIGTTPEIETWIELAPGRGSYEETFSFRWLPRDSVARRKEAEAREIVLENGIFRARLTTRGAALRALWLKKYSEEKGRPPSEDTWIPMVRDLARPGERALTLGGAPEVYGSNPAHETWEVEESTDESVTFATTTSNGWRFRKRVALPEEGYALDVTVEVERPGRSDAREANFGLVGPVASYIEDAYRGTFAAEPAGGGLLERGGDDQDQTLDGFESDGELRAVYTAGSRDMLRAVFIRGAYFVCALVTGEPDAEGAGPATIAAAEVRHLRLTEAVQRPDGSTSDASMLGRVDAALPLGDAGRGRVRYRLYAGPNSRPALGRLDIEETVDFGFFGLLGRGLMWLLKMFQGLVGNWGVAIMLLTFSVRALLLPISFRTQVGMQRYQKKIQKIKPILEELEKRYPNNPQKMNQERMRVMREHGVGFPLGCLTMFLQIPIWFALFQALRVEFSLRHAEFLWAADLSMPDRVMELPFWPGYLNLFPILMLVLWVAQQKLAPTPGSNDPQMAMQMKMMRFMPYMFFIMLYRYASALSIYMCVSSMWTIFESRYVRKTINKMDL